jgi:hypothetical protein
MWCAVKARENTTHLSNETLGNGPVPGAQVSTSYNAAASAVMGIWLFFEVWLINTSVLFALVRAALLTVKIDSEHIDLNIFCLQ